MGDCGHFFKDSLVLNIELNLYIVKIQSTKLCLLIWSSCSENILSVLQTDDGEDDLKKGTQLLEIYALEIQMYTAQKNNKKLKVPLCHRLCCQII